MTSKGLELVSPEKAGSTEAYKNYERLEKAAPSMAEQIGFMTIYPSDTVFYIKGLDRQGKVKKGGFMGAISKNQTNDPNFEVMQIFPKLSSQLEDTIIANVDLYVFFIKDLNTFKGNAASIKVKTSLR